MKRNQRIALARGVAHPFLTRCIDERQRAWFHVTRAKELSLASQVLDKPSHAPLVVDWTRLDEAPGLDGHEHLVAHTLNLHASVRRIASERCKTKRTAHRY